MERQPEQALLATRADLTREVEERIRQDRAVADDPDQATLLDHRTAGRCHPRDTAA